MTIQTKRCRLAVMRVLSLGAMVLLGTSLASAQFTSGIQGTVEDTTHAAVVGSTVEVVNEATQVKFQTTSNESGFFRVPALPQGIYRIEVREEGFKAWTQTHIVLEGDQIRTLYPILTIGEQVSVVTVTGGLAAIDTVRSNVSRSIEAKTVESAPMLGRNIYSGVGALAAGVTGSGGLFGGGYAQNQDSFVNEPGFQINAAGQRQEQNEYEVDGTSVNGVSRDGIANLTPEPDTVQEIRVAANSFSAEKGRNSGALVEVFTKSGSNDFHGTLSEFHTDNALTARTEFQSKVPLSRRNEYGFTLGGPVIKNRTFLFGSFFKLSAANGFTTVEQEETPQFRSFVQNTFPNSLAARFYKIGIPGSDPTTGMLTVAQVMKANPGSYPTTLFPLDLPAVGIATVSETTTRPAYQWNFRVDQNLNNFKDRVYFNWFATSTNGQNANARTYGRTIQPSTGEFGRLDWTHTISSALLNEAAVSYVRADGHTPSPTGAELLPSAYIGGTSTGFGNGGFYSFAHDNFIFHEGVLWNRKNHALHMGVDWDKQNAYANQSNAARPSFNFSNIFDFAQDLPFSQSGPVVDIGAGQVGVNLHRKVLINYAGVYLQDEWKATPKLTISAGLRWDYFGNWGSGFIGKHPFPLFTPGAGSSFAEQVASGTMQVRNGGVFTTNRPNGISPRIGIAYDLFGNGSTSIRGAYGVFYSRVGNLSYVSNGSNTNPPALGLPSISIQQSGAQFSYALGSQGGSYFPLPPGFQFQPDPRGGIVGSRVSVGGNQADISQPRTQSWTFSVQRRLGHDLVAEFDYLGTHSDRLYTQTDVNRFAGDLLVNGGKLQRLNPSFNQVIFGRTIGIANSNLFSLAVGKRFSRSWSTHGIYTMGRAIDADSSNDNGVGNGRNVIDVANLNAQKGRADFDVKRRVSLDGVLDVPNPFKQMLVSKITGGWQVTTIAILQSGTPFSVYTSASRGAGGDYNADGFNFDFPNAPTFGNTISVSRSNFLHGVFKASDFPKPVPGQEGNLGRNTYEGPGLANVNMNLTKSFSVPWFLSEHAKVELRGEIFNIFNRVNLSGFVSDLSSGLFGRATNQNLPRAVQLGARISY